MGLNLKLLPIFNRFDSSAWLSFSSIEVIERTELFESIIKVEKNVGILVPPNFTSYLSRGDGGEEPHYGETLWTPYGEPVMYITVKHLLDFKNHEGVTNNFVNRAVWAYLKELPEKTRIALFWS